MRPATPLPEGAYTVRWQITALDGDVVDGSFGFGVGAAAAPPADSSAPQTSGLTAAAMLRWALFMSLAVALGGLAGDALARHRVRQAWPERALVAPGPWLVPAGILGVAASLGLALHSMGGGSLTQGLANASVPAPLASPTGRLIAVELIGFVVATVVATIRPLRWLMVFPLAAVVVAEGLRSHLQTEAPPIGSMTVIVHLAAVAIWGGALIHVVRTAVHWRQSPGQARALFLEYSLIALALYALVVATGTTAAILVLPTVDALWATSYGQILLAKLVLVATASTLAVAARRRLRRHSYSKTVALSRIEWSALVAVFAASAVLTAVAPPAEPGQALAYPPPARGPTVRLGTLAGQITTGVIAGEGQLEVRLRVPEWDPNADHDFNITGSITNPDGDRTTLTLEPCGAGCYVGPAQWGVGSNELELDIKANVWRGAVTTFEVPWPAQDAQALFDRMLDTMTGQPAVVFVESATSDTTRATPFRSDELALTGGQLIDLQPYRSGAVNAPTILSRDGDTTHIGFAISSESIYVRQTLAPDGRLLAETLISPNHLLERTYTYPAG